MNWQIINGCSCWTAGTASGQHYQTTTLIYHVNFNLLRKIYTEILGHLWTIEDKMVMEIIFIYFSHIFYIAIWRLHLRNYGIHIKFVELFISGSKVTPVFSYYNSMSNACVVRVCVEYFMPIHRDSFCQVCTI